MCNTSAHFRSDLTNIHVKPFSIPTLSFLRAGNRLMFSSTDYPFYYGLPNSSNRINSFELDDIDIDGEKLIDLSPENSPLLDVIGNDRLTEPAHLNEERDIVVLTSLDKAKTTNGNKPIEKKFILNESNFGDPSNMPVSSLPFISTPVDGSYVANKFSLPTFEFISNSSTLRGGSDMALMEINRFNGIYPSFMHRRPRGEKRPIPEEQKDEKYYERRKRNNEAAKKSRDARKIREDRIAFRAALLEQENALLRAQLLTLRDEIGTLRALVNKPAIPPS